MLSHLPNDTLLQSGKYRIVRFLSSGGFGCTYEAIHTMFNIRIAIKEFFVKDFCNRDESTASISVGTNSKIELVSRLRRKFIEEARSLFLLSHPNIVRVTDVFEENGTAYYVMDYIDGESLYDIITKEGAMSEERAMRYIRQAAEALAYVHSKHRLHLDIKPGNIMIGPDDNAILIDFGISKQFDVNNTEQSSTPIASTLCYAPIEQMNNDIHRFNPATDIYALAATLYKLITGKTPPNPASRISGEETLALPDGLKYGTYATINEGMKIRLADRPQTMEDFIKLFDAEPKTEPEQTEDKPGGTSEEADKPVDSEDVDEVEVSVVLDDEQSIVAEVEEDISLPPLTSADPTGPQWVDMGLPSGTKWALCNLGADCPEYPGLYFQWGSTTPATGYNQIANMDMRVSIWHHFMNNLTPNMSLNPQDDAATAMLGQAWRTPTANDFAELLYHTFYQYTIYNGVRGLVLTSRINGNSLFFPLAGVLGHGTGMYGQYWTSTPQNNDFFKSFILLISDSMPTIESAEIDIARPIRPVTL